MTPERWNQVVDVFVAASEHDADRQRRYIAAACGDDADLRAGVEELLRNDALARTVDFLSEAPWVIDEVPVFLPDFEEYCQIEYLGHGGMGIVYRAFDKNLDTEVALKTCLPRRFLTRQDVERFRTEPKSIARLRHPHIVQVYKVGEYDGRPFFTMSLIKRARDEVGLESHLQRFQEDPSAAVRLMIKVARAVHHAHQRGILHRDLKPANILLDDEEQPHISDFGLAKHIESGTELTECDGPLAATSVARRGIVGTISYMSPEQADPDAGQDVTTLSDVYGLGATLYTMLTGRAPWQAETLQRTLQLVRNPQGRPQSPQALNPHVDGTLASICLKCLDKSAEGRYRSAEGMAKDLERWLRHERTEVPQSLWVRSKNFLRRQPGLALLAMATALLLVLSIVMVNLAADYMERSAGQRNTIAAQRVADDIRLRLRDLSDYVLDTARSQDVRDLLRQTAGVRNPAGAWAFLETQEGTDLKKKVDDALAKYNEDLRREGIPEFATMFFLNAQGIDVAHAAFSAGNARDIIGHPFELRDYFAGAKARSGREGRASVHISRVFQSIYDRYFKFAICVPVLDDDGTLLGAVEASIPMHHTLGLGERWLHDWHQKVVLAGRIDAQPQTLGAAPPDYATHDYAILLHEAFKYGEREGDDLRTQGFFLDDPPWHERDPKLEADRELSEPSEQPIPPIFDFKDPLAQERPEYAGRWIAGVARVGNTELVVIVQERYAEAIGPPVALAKSVVLWGWSGLGVAAIIAAAVVWRRGNRSRSHARQSAP